MVKVEPAASAKMKKKELVESEVEEEGVIKEEEEEVVGGGGGGLEEYCQPSHTPFPPLGRPLLHTTQYTALVKVRGSDPYWIRIQWTSLSGSVFNGSGSVFGIPNTDADLGTWKRRKNYKENKFI